MMSGIIHAVLHPAVISLRWATKPRYSLLWSNISFAAAVATFCLLWLPSHVFAQLSPLPFAWTFTPKQSTIVVSEDLAVQETIGYAKQVAKTMVFFTSWSDPDNFAGLQQHVQAARDSGLDIAICVTINTLPGIYAPANYVASFSDPETAQLYVYNMGLLAAMQPKFLVLYAEVNILAQYNSNEYANYQEIYSNASHRAKSISPNTLVGVSLLDAIWVQNRAQEINLPYALGNHDFIAVTSYPANQFNKVSDVPANWYLQWRTAYPNERLLFTEIGWTTATPGSLDEQANFVLALPKLMEGVNPELITWALAFDGKFYLVQDLTQSTLAFYQSIHTDPAALFNRLNNTGLITDQGVVKPAWRAVKILFGLGP
jgi:hypothetical protein